MNAKDQIITPQYAIYNSDCMLVMPGLKDNSVDLSVYSPPFAGLYNYSSSERDFSNCENKEQFLEQYEYLIAQIQDWPVPKIKTVGDVSKELQDWLAQ